jgi:hypothetical protein
VNKPSKKLELDLFTGSSTGAMSENQFGAAQVSLSFASNPTAIGQFQKDLSGVVSIEGPMMIR